MLAAWGYMLARTLTLGASALSIVSALSLRLDENKVIDPSTTGPLKWLFWLHVPKTGSSFATTLAHYSCGEGIPRNLTVKEPTEFMKRWGSACPGDAIYRFWSGHDPFRADAPLNHVVTMVRDPIQRIVSGYYANPVRLHDCQALRKKYHCHSSGWGSPERPYDEENAIPCDGDTGSPGHYVTNTSVIPPVDYAECVRNCLTNMLTGQGCSHDGPADVDLAVDRVGRLGFVGLTEHWAASVCLFHTRFGGQVVPAELENLRLGNVSHSSSSVEALSLLKDWVPANDMRVWRVAQERFWSEVKAHNITKASCEARFPDVSWELFDAGPE